MEDTLRGYVSWRSIKRESVLILVLMEDTLRVVLLVLIYSIGL
mgnify:FL=1